MTELSFDDEGVDVVYEGTSFRMDRQLIEEATEKPYWEVTDHEVLRMVDPDPHIDGEPRQIGDLVEPRNR